VFGLRTIFQFPHGHFQNSHKFFVKLEIIIMSFLCFTFVKCQQKNSSISIRNINFNLSIEMSITSSLIHQGMLSFQVYVHDEVLSIHICEIYDCIRGWGSHFSYLLGTQSPLDSNDIFLYLIINKIFVNIYVIYQVC
jgi:hypothetical protein